MSSKESQPSAVHAARRPVRRYALWLAVAACAAILCGGGLKFVLDARDLTLMIKSKGFMKQIGIASHNFHDVYGHFPPIADDGSDDPAVSARLSMHTSILPFFEHTRLFKSIDTSVSWQSAVNRSSYSTAVFAYSSPYFGENIGTDGYALTHFVPNDRVIGNGRGMPIGDVSDGLTNTIFIGSVDAAFPAWGDPEGGRDPANGFAGGAKAFGGPEEFAIVGLMDGSVRTISATTDPEIAKSLATPDFGDEVPRDY